MLAPLWMLALPFIGALGAWLNGAIMTLGVPLSMIVERHFSLSIKLTAYIVYMIASCLGTISATG